MNGVKEELILSTLPKTWIFDLDGTLVKHNGYILDGKDTLLEGVLEHINSIPREDKIIILTARKDEYRKMTLDFLAGQKIRYDEILFNMPMGERILVNDKKKSGLEMSIAINVERDVFRIPDIRREK